MKPDRIRYPNPPHWSKFGFFLGWILLVTGCSEPTQVAKKVDQQSVRMQSGEVVYPHSEEFKKSRNHGQAFLKDRGLCASCHGEDGQGGTTQVSCKSCHNYPHAENWSPKNPSHKKVHEEAYRKELRNVGDRKIVSCQHCHGEDWQGGTTQVSCKSCHNYPHGPGWVLPQVHGKNYIEESQNPKKHKSVSCSSCHPSGKPEDALLKNKKEYQDGSPIYCNSCHVSLPHSDDFVWGEHAEVATTPQGKCLGCHSDYKRLFSKRAEDEGISSCKDCHEDGEMTIHWWEEPDRSPDAISQRKKKFKPKTLKDLKKLKRKKR